MLQKPLSCAIIFCQRFYYTPFKYKEARRSIWSIITKPLSADYRRLVRPSNQITCLNARYYCHSLYQVKKNYDHLHQQSYKDIENSVAVATAIVFYDDPFNFPITCIFLLGLLPEPPDGAHKSMLSLTLILFIYLYPLVRVLIIHWSRTIFDELLSKYNRNVFVRHGRRRCSNYRPIPTLYAR